MQLHGRFRGPWGTAEKPEWLNGRGITPPAYSRTGVWLERGHDRRAHPPASKTHRGAGPKLRGFSQPVGRWVSFPAVAGACPGHPGWTLQPISITAR